MSSDQLEQAFPTLGGKSVELTGDVYNVLNLLTVAGDSIGSRSRLFTPTAGRWRTLQLQSFGRLARVCCAASIVAVTLGACGDQGSISESISEPDPDRTPPRVTQTSPPDGATSVPADAEIDVWFTEDLQAGSAVSSFSVTPQVQGIVVSPIPTRILLLPEPSVGLAPGTRYTATVSTGAKDIAGNSLAAPYSWSFTTAGPSALRFVSLNAGVNHTCGVAGDGAAYCWGSNGYGQLGMGNSGFLYRKMPVAVSGGLSLATVGAGSNHTCGLTAAGVAYCWGSNFYGQLADGTTTYYRYAPVPVSGGFSFSDVGAGYAFTCALTAAGAVYCWGYNDSGRLGDGTTENRFAPVLVAGGLNFASITVGDDHACGITASGAAYCWGKNATMQLGDGTQNNRAAPVPVAGGLTFASVSAGGLHTCGLTQTGAAYCWGYNASGQLGDGTTTAQSNPVPVTGGRSFVRLVLGEAHTCGLTAAGAIYCWGSNAWGQLGDGTTNNRSAPAPVLGGLTFASVTAGRGQTCGTTQVGAAYCWGLNVAGQLGDATQRNRYAPTAVMQ